MAFDSITIQEANDDFATLYVEEKPYLVPYQEIADFSADTESFSRVYREIRRTDKSVIVAQIRNLEKLRFITERWALGQQDSIEERVDITQVPRN